MSLAIIALLAIFIAREYTHMKHDERRDVLISELTDKIKAKDLTEYKMLTEPTPVFEPVDRSDEDLYAMEIEEQKR